MDELVKQVAEKTGISTDQAQTAVNTVISFLKTKLPEPIAGQLENLAGGQSAGGGLGDLASKAGSLFK
jgi:hypothetical protein